MFERFSPRARHVVVLAQEEARTLRHNYIGTEHVLLGVIREGEGIGAQVIRAHVDDLLKVRMAVLDLIPTQASETAPRWLRQPDPGVMAGAGRGEELRTTPAADASLNAAVRLAGPQPVGSHHLLLAALDDPRSAAFRALVTLGIDLDRARTALREVDVTDTNDEPPEEAGRRQMLIRATENQLIIETTDRTLLELAHAAIAAAGAESDQPGTIRGDRPDSASLGRVWQSLRDSLEDIRRRASAQSSVAGQEQEQEPVEGKGSGAVEDEPAEPRGAAEG